MNQPAHGAYHSMLIFTEDKEGHDLLPNGQAPAAYQDFTKYSTPGGLLQILR